MAQPRTIAYLPQPSTGGRQVIEIALHPSPAQWCDRTIEGTQKKLPEPLALQTDGV